MVFPEPASGLDSEASYQVVSMISEIAKKFNKTVIMTVHQPSSRVYRLFDKICLLSLGRVVYFGNLPDSLKFFQSIDRPVPKFFNPPEHFLKITNVDFVQDLETASRTIDDWADKFIEFNNDN
jgi:ABC-type multidrug transport system ATPase subunit